MEQSGPTGIPRWVAPSLPLSGREKRRVAGLAAFLIVVSLGCLAIVWCFRLSNRTWPRSGYIGLSSLVIGISVLICLPAKWCRTRVRFTEDGVCLGSSFRRYGKMRYVRFSRRTIDTQNVETVIFVYQNWIAREIALPPEIKPDQIRGFLSGKVAICNADSRAFEDLMSPMNRPATDALWAGFLGGGALSVAIGLSLLAKPDVWSVQTPSFAEDQTQLRQRLEKGLSDGGFSPEQVKAMRPLTMRAVSGIGHIDVFDLALRTGFLLLGILMLILGLGGLLWNKTRMLRMRLKYLECREEARLLALPPQADEGTH